jgi:hypothetical protein
MMVCVSMDAYISICTVAKSSIRCLSHPIPSVEFSPTNSLEDEGKLFVHSNPPEQVHIVYTSVTNLSLAERLILLHLLIATNGNVVSVCSHRNVIMCKIADRPPPVSCSEGTKDEERVESCDPSLEHEPEPWLDGPDKSARFTPPIHFFILHNTCNKNRQQEVPSTLGVSISRTGGRNEGLCREITSDDASKKTYLLQH